ncbi:MAG: long-chain fatty acid--CoA ligase [Chloroflexota bacterium]
MLIDSFLDRVRENTSAEALIWHDQPFTYETLLTTYTIWVDALTDAGIPSGSIVALEADYSLNSVAILLALFNLRSIVVPLTGEVATSCEQRCEIANVEWVVQVDGDDQVTIQQRCPQPAPSTNHPLIAQLRHDHPGLILFTSGSTGKPKAAIHNVHLLLEKCQTRRQVSRTLLYLRFDSISGVNMLLYVLANGGCAIVAKDSSPESVAIAIANHQVQFLPTSPTFLTFLLLSKVYEQYDLSSLEVISYGSEMMPKDILAQLVEIFPHIYFNQAFGMTEFGVLRTKSRTADSLWFSVKQGEFAARVTDGLLEIKTPIAMLGYLNAPSPFTEDGWLITGDMAEVDGVWIKILGRKSDLMNIGGQKVYPAEVEDVIQMMDGVVEVVVKGEQNPITGNIVTAKVRLATEESLRSFRSRLHAFCKGKLEPYKIPMRIRLAEEALHSTRFKKVR